MGSEFWFGGCVVGRRVGDGGVSEDGHGVIIWYVKHFFFRSGVIKNTHLGSSVRNASQDLGRNSEAWNLKAFDFRLANLSPILHHHPINCIANHDSLTAPAHDPYHNPSLPDNTLL